MSKFNVGDKVYCFGVNSVGLITDILKKDDPFYPYYPVEFRYNNGFHFKLFTLDGKRWCDDKNPTLFTLEEALKKGLITGAQFKKHTGKTALRHVMFRTPIGKLMITSQKYKSKKEFKTMWPEKRFVKFCGEGMEIV